MRLIGDHDDVPATGQHRIVGLAALGRDLLDGREHDAARGAGQDLPQLLPTADLPWGLAEKITAHGESAEKLIVEIVAVGDDDDGRVRHGRVGDDLPGIEGHEQALAGALGVPDDANAAIAAGAGRLDRARDRMAHGVKLVIPGHDLDEAGARVAEDGETPDQGQKPRLLEHPLDEGAERRRTPSARRRSHPRCARA